LIFELVCETIGKHLFCQIEIILQPFATMHREIEIESCGLFVV
jgi:hypothetical protein